jgi:hypothetical protein
MKQVIYSDRVKQSPDFSAIEAATLKLEEIVRRYADEVTAEWDRPDDFRNTKIFTLRLADWSGAATVIITREELQSEQLLRGRQLQVWGDLLQIRSHRILEQMAVEEPVGV